MDPLSAFGLAASTVQFITFATTLIHKSIEIYGSGSTDETRSLEATYQTLSQFSHSLGSFGNVNHLDPGFLSQIQPLMRLSDSCHDDCEKLLEVVSKLKVATNARRRLLKTFKVAWAAFIKDDEIASLEQRLARSQATLTLCICQMSKYVMVPRFNYLCIDWVPNRHSAKTKIYSYYLRIHGDELSTLKSEANKRHLNQDAQLTSIQTKLDDFKRIIQAKTSNQTTSFSDSEVETLHEQLSTFDILKKDIARDHIFLDSLCFRRQPERYKSIPKAHTQTFSWILDPASTGTEARKLRRWLEQTEGGIFWVSGKPGSGKSTLMKFVADNEKTKEILSIWAQGRKLIIASHYFWWSGTALQKSQEGLLRTLLYSILRQCPDLIRTVSKDRWAKDPNLVNFGEAESIHAGSWAVEELHAAFNAIAHHPDIPVRFCFFIDGLDEYEGDHKEICDIFIQLARESSAIKLCLSSRPWNVFQQALGNEQGRICVHDLTREDMRAFAQSRLSQHPQWNAVSMESPGVKGLANEITERAQGVFLWVFLVTGLLCGGLDNGDSFGDLQLRLKTFPSDLERFFREIFERVDSFYHAKVSSVLQIALEAEAPLDISLYAFHEEEFENRDYAIDKKIGALSDEAIEQRHRVMTQRLNGWSKGLVEVRNREVHFLHRTVVDFLKTREMEAFIMDKLPPWSCASLSVLKAHLAWIKTSNFADSFPILHSAKPTTLKLRVEEALRWAFNIEVTLPASSPEQDTVGLLLDDMEHSIVTLHDSVSVGFLDEKENQPVQKFFRKSVLLGHLAGYLSRKLLILPDYLQFLDKPAISVLIDSQVREVRETPWTKSWSDTLRCLLAAGHDPNQKYREQENRNHPFTPWTKFLSTVICWDELKKCPEQSDRFVSAIHSGLFSLFLGHGANPHALIFRSGQTFPVFSTTWVDMLLMSFEISSKVVDQDVYLQELNAFLQHGAKIDAASRATIVSNELVSNGALAYEAFFSQLEWHVKSGRCNVSLLERLTETLLGKIQDSRIGLDWALGKVSTALRPATCQRLRSDLEIRGKAIAFGGKKKNKRRRGKSSGGGSKR